MAELTIGPILFHWPAERKRDFYFRIADEAPVETVYLGEVVCSKRAPFFEPHYLEIAERLVAAGKRVVFSSLAEIMIKRERQMTRELCAQGAYPVEANDGAALYHLRGRAHRIGPFVNVYNEDTLAVLAARGATHVTLPPELPGEAVREMGTAARDLGVGLEVLVYGRVPLALSARCYHARAHDRVKDNCQFVCEEDPDGMCLSTIGGAPFLAVNGIQTLSHGYQNLAGEVAALQEMGVGALRISPQSGDMVAVARTFRALTDGAIGPDEATARLAPTAGDAPFCNGFFHHREGYRWLAPYQGAVARA